MIFLVHFYTMYACVCMWKTQLSPSLYLLQLPKYKRQVLNEPTCTGKTLDITDIWFSLLIFTLHVYGREFILISVTRVISYTSCIFGFNTNSFPKHYMRTLYASEFRPPFRHIVQLQNDQIWFFIISPKPMRIS